ncbi:MAG: biotin synthase BioB [Humidesulfovibrio sp.]|nr:biotin synthase BioB [Humidesulfovibrio sp.]
MSCSSAEAPRDRQGDHQDDPLGDPLDRAIALALDARALDSDAVRAVTDCAAADLPRLLEGARAVRRRHLGRTLSLCAIINAKSGACSEDCAFCAQSSRHKTDSPRHAFLDPAEIGRAAAAMKTRGAARFGIVASGLAPSEAEFEKLLRAVALVRGAGLAADVSVGVLTRERLLRLKAAGLSGVHHNLEVARSFFPRICTTHDYEDDVEAVRLALAEGLFVCSGGIFGLGESFAQRAELAETLRGLGVTNVPMNFLIPIPGTRMADRPVLSPAEALHTVALFRLMLPLAQLRVCGGRGTVFGPAGGEGQRALFDSGASGLMIGDYLTIAGAPPEADLALARSMGFTLAAADAGQEA